MSADALPDVSVVVATHNRPGHLAALLESLRDQTLAPEDYEVVVVDDGSTPETTEVLERVAQRGEMALRFTRLEPKQGPAAARNHGWRAARAPIVAFSDDDCVTTPGWLEAGLRAARDHPGAIIQGVLEPTPGEEERSPFQYTVSNWQCGPWYEAANIFYPRGVLERLGGFDETRFHGVGGEDTDLAWRAIALGTPTRLAEDALVYHAIMDLGPWGRLRRAARWTETVGLFAEHPGLRRHLVLRVFWNRQHLELAQAALATALPGRFWPLKYWLAAPYVVYLTKRRAGPLLAPYLIAHDLVEVAAVVRGAVRYRTPVL